MDKKSYGIILLSILLVAVSAAALIMGLQQVPESKLTQKQNSEIYSLNQALAIFATRPRTDWDSNTWQLNQTIPIQATLSNPAVGISSATINCTINIYFKDFYYGANIRYSDGTMSPTILVDEQAISELKTLQISDS